VELQHPLPLCLHGLSSGNTLREITVQLQNGYVFVVRRKRQTATRANTAKPEALRMLLMENKNFRDVRPCGLVGMWRWHFRCIYCPVTVKPNLNLRISRQAEPQWVYQLRGVNYKLRLCLHSLYCTPDIPAAPYRLHIAVCTKISVAVENVSMQWSHLFE